MAICNPTELLAAASGFSALTEKQLDVVMVGLLREWAGNTDTPSDLLYAARCWQCLDTKQLEMAQAQLLCNINSGDAPAAVFSYEPATAIIIWNDSGGDGQSGDLDFFTANADVASVTLVNVNSRGITSISNLSSLTALTTLNCYGNSLTALDLTGCVNLTDLNCKDNIITSLDVSPCVALLALLCFDNSITTLNVDGCVSLVNLICFNNSMNAASVSVVLCATDTNGASNGTLNITGNAVPTAGGLVCSGNLDPGKGWTVTHD